MRSDRYVERRLSWQDGPGNGAVERMLRRGGFMTFELALTDPPDNGTIERATKHPKARAPEPVERSRACTIGQAKKYRATCQHEKHRYAPSDDAARNHEMPSSLCSHGTPMIVLLL